ncbi:MAG: hypothetical protein ACR2MS_06890 [Weeksellaceae bacterium]
MMKNILLFIVVLTLYNCKTTEIISHNTEVLDLVTKIEDDIYNNFSFVKHPSGKKTMVPFKDLYNREDFFVVLIPKIKYKNKNKKFKRGDNFLTWIDLSTKNYDDPDVYIYDADSKFVDRFSYYDGYDKSLILPHKNNLMELYARKILKYKNVYIVDNKNDYDQFYLIEGEDNYYAMDNFQFKSLKEYINELSEETVNAIIQENHTIIVGDPSIR